MITNVLTFIFGFLIFLFLLWRKLKEDYISSQIFTTAFYVLAGVTFGYFISKRFFPAWWFWESLVSGFVGLIIGVARFKLRFFEVFEASAIGFIFWIATIYFVDAIKLGSISSFVGFLILSVLILLFYYFQSHYRDFAWYKSGKIGFASLSCLGIFFTLRALFATLFPFVLSFVGRWEIAVSAISAFVCFLVVFNLSIQK